MISKNVLLGLLFFGALAILIYTNTFDTPVDPSKDTPVEDTTAETPEGPSKGIWVRAESVGNPTEHGLNKDESVKYCTDNKGTLATKQQLMDAKEKGFEMCMDGWHTSDGKFEIGHVMNSEKKNCGPIGYTVKPDTEPEHKSGTYCYGVIPDNVKGTNFFAF